MECEGNMCKKQNPQVVLTNMLTVGEDKLRFDQIDIFWIEISGIVVCMQI